MRPYVMFVGALAGLVALLLMWAARLTIDRTVYVSEMGAQGEPTSGTFQVALGLVALSGILVGAGRIRDAVAILVMIAGMCFAVAATVPCTRGCPPPGTPAFSLQDAAHLSFAIAGFLLACCAMLRAAQNASRRLAVVSLASSGAVAVISAAGGLLSLTHTATGFGAMCEFVAASIAVLWLTAVGVTWSVPAMIGPSGSDRFSSATRQ